MSDCIFCKIANGEIPSNKVYEDEKVIAFNDINPEAPKHILLIPKKHYASIMEVPNEEMDIVAHVHKAIKEIAKTLEIDKSGFRIVSNCGVDGGQTVGHIHYHLLGGRSLNWPPG